MSVKVLPVTIAACACLISLKVAQLSGIFEEPEETAASEITISAKAVTPKPAVTAAKEISSFDELVEQEKIYAGEGGEGLANLETAAAAPKEDEKKKDELPPNVSRERPEEKLPIYRDSEKEVLQKLSARRSELDAWQKDLEMKEELIGASSKKLDVKLDELKKLKADTEALLAQYHEQEDAKIKSLVKMYENMKPAAAASIFEEMDMDIMLEIVDKMAEKKASLVLAKMSPKKAKDVTEKLALQRSFAEEKGVAQALGTRH